ncbi:sulfotransferase [Luteolibacter flavescens]|uniref:Sulfotransferase n=1 Tax=Luteolibacter flavescens TaxID=1859460 RepID=A0ABT3FND5_9BACT|nr:tetratricopeptide repeat-containing sulfotransferase family protein [Luteolibacter flavescens]MCW1884977.1 sulfotransferase [Luteolibacter flavescens]
MVNDGGAGAALARGDVEGALAIWQRVTARRDATPGELLGHATLLFRLYRAEDSHDLLERLLVHPAAGVEEWLVVARLWFERGRFDRCARFSGRALAAVPDSPDIGAMHAAALERSGDKEGAREVIGAFLVRHPEHARLVRLLAHIERGDGDFEKARARLEDQLRRFSGGEDWRLRYELAAVLDRLGEHAGAMRELEMAKAELEPQSQRYRSQWRSMTERQWAVTQSLTRERLARWADAGSVAQAGDEREICLMGGFPRSGTTLLEKVISTHAGCIGTDESGVLATQFRDPLVFGAGSAKEVVTELDAFHADDLAAGREEYFRCTADLLGEDPGGRLLIEKEPLLTADLAVPLRLFPDARVLMPLRDPRDVVVSYFFTMVPASRDSVAAATLEETCRYYAEVMRHWLLLRERLDAGRWQWMESRYEDLIAAAEVQTRRLAGFLGLEWEEGMMAHHRRAGRAVGTPTYDDVSKPLYTRSLARWRNYERWLEPHLGMLEKHCAALGYEA